MSNYRFEDSVAWQKAQELCVSIYKLFKANHDVGFRDQITRAAVSVSNNIAEGLERGTAQEMKHFLYIAKGSCGETRSMLHLALKLGYITEKDFNLLSPLTTEISKLLYASINKN